MSENVGKVFNLTGGQGQSGGVPDTRKINGKPLSSDITLTASDVGAAESEHTHTAADVGARPSSWTPSAADVGAVPATRKVNGKTLSADVTLSASDVGAASSGHTHTAADVGALPAGGGTLTGDLRIKGDGNYGNKINLGDGDYVHFSEPTDDCLEIKAKKINFVTSATTDDKFTLNGIAIGGGSSIAPAANAPKAAGTAAVGTSAKYAREDHVHPSQTSISGNAGSATKLTTARTIDGVSFNGSASIVHYGVCSTAGEYTNKTVSCTGFTLVTGAKIAVKFEHANTADGHLTLNVNGTGAKTILPFVGIPYINYSWASGEVVEFIYDGSVFAIVGGGSSHTCGFYYGNGRESLTISLGYRPKFMIISGIHSFTALSEFMDSMKYFYAGSADLSILYQLEFTDFGFKVYADQTHDRFPILNENGRKYVFVAFK